ncbi:MAG: 4Fe-4S double cluster binding domain-containing protein [Candidatus Ratteibacteria bacterium]|nr:4Fe-4S double cluster binding domain-containing protein [Candidatus Ratteibacteria bacterium]
MEKLKKEIIEYAIKSGFVGCGVVGIDDFPEYKNALDALIKNFPEAEPLYRPMYNRTLIKERVPWARSVIVCLRYYRKYHIPAQVRGYIARNYLFDCRVPQSPEYLMVKGFADYLREKGMRVRKGGVPDRLVAYRAGLVSIGKNSFAYAGKYGSWINIITYLVDAELEPDVAVATSPCPPDCRICMDACPTGAIVRPYTVRMDRCIAYLTYSAPLPIDEKLEGKMGRWVYGCDICQEVCPLNKDTWEGKEKLLYLEEIAHLLTPDALIKMDMKIYQDIVYPLFSYIPLGDIERWHRNAERVMRLSAI